VTSAHGRIVQHACNVVEQALRRHPGVGVSELLKLAKHRGMPGTIELRRAWADPGLREAVGYLIGAAHASGVSPRAAAELGGLQLRP
jgi:hypothetical protein